MEGLELISGLRPISSIIPVQVDLEHSKSDPGWERERTIFFRREGRLGLHRVMVIRLLQWCVPNFSQYYSYSHSYPFHSDSEQRRGVS